MYNDVKSGLSRRSFMRTLGAASVAATSLPAFAALQQAPAAAAGRRAGAGAGGGDFGGSSDPDVVKISSNENPLGPSDLARWAIASTGPLGGRYGGGIGLGNQPSQILSEQFGLVAKPVAADAAAQDVADAAAETPTSTSTPAPAERLTSPSTPASSMAKISSSASRATSRHPARERR